MPADGFPRRGVEILRFDPLANGVHLPHGILELSLRALRRPLNHFVLIEKEQRQAAAGNIEELLRRKRVHGELQITVDRVLLLGLPGLEVDDGYTVIQLLDAIQPAREFEIIEREGERLLDSNDLARRAHPPREELSKQCIAARPREVRLETRGEYLGRETPAPDLQQRFLRELYPLAPLLSGE